MPAHGIDRSTGGLGPISVQSVSAPQALHSYGVIEPSLQRFIVGVSASCWHLLHRVGTLYSRSTETGRP